MDPRYEDSTNDTTTQQSASQAQDVNFASDEEVKEDEVADPEEMSLENFRKVATDAMQATKRAKEPIYQFMQLRDDLRLAIKTDRLHNDQEYG